MLYSLKQLRQNLAFMKWTEVLMSHQDDHRSRAGQKCLDVGPRADALEQGCETAVSMLP